MGRASGIFPAADWHRRGLSWHPSALRVVNAGGSETAAVPDAPFVGEAAAGTLSQGRVYLVLRAESPLPRQECALLRTTRQPPRRGRSGALPRFTVCERMGMTKLEGNPHAEWLAAYGDPAYWETVAWAPGLAEALGGGASPEEWELAEVAYRTSCDLERSGIRTRTDPSALRSDRSATAHSTSLRSACSSLRNRQAWKPSHTP